MEFPVFQFVPVASLILSLGSTEKHLAPSSLFYKILLSLFFSRLCNHSSLTLSSYHLLQSLNDPHWIHSRSPGQDSTAGGSLLCWDEGKHHITSLELLAQLCLMEKMLPRMLVGFFAPSTHCRLSFNLLPIRTWFLLCLEIISRVIWYTCRMKEKVCMTQVETTWL